MNEPRIVKIEWAHLEGRRPRNAGSNARLGDHGSTVRVPLVRLTTEDGMTGFGRSAATQEQAQAILGLHFSELYSDGATAQGLPFDFALWDLAGALAGQPVYELAAQANGKEAARPLLAPCYDTSLYIDDLHLASDEEAAALIAAEAREGYERGHRAFKIKVGRGARHLPVEEGTERDITVIQAVRAAVGDDATLMIDANNGYTLNLAKRVLAATAPCRPLLARRGLPRRQRALRRPAQLDASQRPRCAYSRWRRLCLAAPARLGAGRSGRCDPV